MSTVANNGCGIGQYWGTREHSKGTGLLRSPRDPHQRLIHTISFSQVAGAIATGLKSRVCAYILENELQKLASRTHGCHPKNT